MEANLLLELVGDFVLEGRERIARVEETLLELPDVPEQDRGSLLDLAKRELHTLKGNAGMLGLDQLQALAHEAEDEVALLDAGAPQVESLLRRLDDLRGLVDRAEGMVPGAREHAKGARSSSQRRDDRLDSLRIPFTDLDELVNVLAEMVIFRNRLHDAITSGRDASSDDLAWDEVEDAEQALGGTLNVIQERIMSLRMVPLRTLFVSLKRIVHDVGGEEGKEVELIASGGDTPMDKALLEVAGEALGHLVRNAVAHGIESPADREAAEKPRRGSIRLTATPEANEVLIEVSDDGRGIDPDAVLAAAAAHGIQVSSTDDPLALLFHSGLSTRPDAGLDAGRGIGLSAALESVRRLGGRIEVSSSLGAGSRFLLHLPLSVSITRALLLRADDELYALPISHVKENMRFTQRDGTEVNHALVMRWREQVIPLVDIGVAFGTRSKPRTRGFVVLFEAAGKRRGLLVDGTAGIREIVVKGLDAMVGSPQGISGSTILGDGRVVLILDATGLVGLDPTQTSHDPKERRHERKGQPEEATVAARHAEEG